MEFIVKVTAAGSAGSATGSADTEAPVRGFIEAIVYSYGTAPNTTTITITEDDKFGNNRAILSVAAGNTAGVAYVRAPAVNLSNASITNSWASIYISGQPLKVAIAAANNGDVVTVRIIVRDRTDVD